ncbi:MAG: hypothetical protein BWX70_01613 [Verrucomicrobia bacterium ADurb.Bin070]|nr:MAG: hypothetical protein BWX70_01613 [Verrucomicrobia bacterium ADurb.Bin070]
MTPRVAKTVGKPRTVLGKSMSAPIRTFTVPDGVISTSGEPSGGGARRRGVKTDEQTATSGSSLSGAGHAPVKVARAYGHPAAGASVRSATSGGPCITRPPGR